MDEQKTNGKTYVCTGSCQAVISEKQHSEGLTNCGDESCDMKGHPLVEGNKSEETGKNEPTQHMA
jgi:hypothetical protein